MRNFIYTKALLCAIIFAFSTLLTNAAENRYTTKSKPRLAVVITINGLQNYQLESFIPSMDKGGFKRIVSEGQYTSMAQCTYMPSDYTADYASLMSGSTPRYHGIVSNKFYSLLDDDIISCIADARYSGINSNANVSARLMQATTIADQIKTHSPKSKVYSIALSPESAIMLGGHLADGAIWLDDKTGKLATTTYYNNGLPKWANKINNDSSIVNFAKQSWYPLFDINKYEFDPVSSSFWEDLSIDKLISTSPIFDKVRGNTIAAKIQYLKESPFVNDIIKELSIRAIQDEKLGTDNAPDLLCIEFNANTKYNSTPFCAENEDLFIRLDRNIKAILDIIDVSVGIENAVIVVTAPNYNNVIEDEAINKLLNQGTFNSSRAMALLNSYLMAIYGQGRWVTGYYNKNINLNKQLIEDNQIKLSEIEDYVAQFMLEFSGVHSAISAYQIQTAASLPNDYPSRLRNSHYKNRSGDVSFTLLPGWYEEEKDKTINTSTLIQPILPIAIIGNEIEPQSQQMMYEDICPTLCYLLNIPLPNACIGQIIPFNR
ncbi:MAG: alkaline phosphatase family protein [bacterium]